MEVGELAAGEAVTGERPRPGARSPSRRSPGEAGVSVPTVSRVVNGRSDVSPQTRARVEDLLHRYGYRKRAAAPGTRAALLDLVFNDLDSPWAVEIIRGVEEVAHAAGVGTVVSAIHGRSGAARAVDAQSAGPRLRRRHPRHLGAGAGTPRRAARPGRPAGGRRPGGLPRPRRPHDRRRQLVGRHGGHRASAVAGPPQDRPDRGPAPAAVLTGPLRRLPGRAGGRGPHAWTSPSSSPATSTPSPASPAATAPATCPNRRPPCSRPATRWLSARSRHCAAAACRVPEDMSLVGFDDLPEVRWSAPPLTTVRQPLADMGKLAVRTVLRLARGEQPDSPRVELGTELVVRSSTAPPARRRTTGEPP